MIWNEILFRLDLASEDINLRVHAMFVCPKKWQINMKNTESAVAKRLMDDNEDSQEEFDDFYIFW